MIYINNKNGQISNIGDYIQSLAALQYLPKNCKPYFLYRDKVQFYNGTKVKLIMNGWHSISYGNTYITNQIIPIFVSYHISNPKKLPEIYIKNLLNFSEIGCRDTNTRDELIKYGVRAYFTSCLTTTLDIDYSAMKMKELMILYLLIINLEIILKQINIFILLEHIILAIL